MSNDDKAKGGKHDEKHGKEKKGEKHEV